MLLVNPVLGKLSLSFLATVAWAAAVHRALREGLALSLKVEAALAIAAAVGVVLAEHWV